MYVWHDKKEGPGITSVYSPFSPWKQWGVAMNGTYYVDNINYNEKENVITARFRETTDFLDMIGMPEGFSATVHYWLDDNGKTSSILYEWDADNTDFHKKLEPIVEWAKENDPQEIRELYLDNGFEPSWLNAIRWRRLLDDYFNKP